MNTEINLLEKQPNKYAPFIKLGTAFFILLLIVVGIILFQQHHYDTKIEQQSSKLEQLENTLKENQEKLVDEQLKKQLISDVNIIKSMTVPNVKLYRNIQELLPNVEQFVSYEVTETNDIVMEAQFKTLTDVAAYVKALFQQSYIQGAELTSISLNESTYQAIITITVNQEILMKELGNNE